MSRMKVPLIAQPRIVGVRAQWSENQWYIEKPYEPVCLSHIRPISDSILDGVLYIPDCIPEVIERAVRTPTKLSPELVYLVFDTVSSSHNLARLPKHIEGRNVGIVPSKHIVHTKDIEKVVLEHILAGYSGTIFKDPLGKRIDGIHKVTAWSWKSEDQR